MEPELSGRRRLRGRSGWDTQSDPAASSFFLGKVTAMNGRLAFTLIESLIALVILGMAAAVLLLATESSTHAARDATEKTIAIGLAEQLLDEVLGQPYHAAGQSSTASSLGPSGSEAAGAGRERYNETGDYNGYSAKPVVDFWGVRVGDGDGAGGLRHANLRTGRVPGPLPGGSPGLLRQRQ